MTIDWIHLILAVTGTLITWRLKRRSGQKSEGLTAHLLRRVQKPGQEAPGNMAEILLNLVKTSTTGTPRTREELKASLAAIVAVAEKIAQITPNLTDDVLLGLAKWLIDNDVFLNLLTAFLAQRKPPTQG